MYCLYEHDKTSPVIAQLHFKKTKWLETTFLFPCKSMQNISPDELAAQFHLYAQNVQICMLYNAHQPLKQNDTLTKVKLIPSLILTWNMKGIYIYIFRGPASQNIRLITLVCQVKCTNRTHKPHVCIFLSQRCMRVYIPPMTKVNLPTTD